MSTAITEKPTATETLATLADKINDHHRKAEAALRSGLEHTLEAGRLLLEAKGQCAHGEWGAWLAENFEGSERTAQAYMRVAKRWPEIQAKAQHVADLSFRDAVKLLATPKESPVESEDEALPENFTPGPGRCLVGRRDVYSVYVAESIRHPGYWNVIVVDRRPKSRDIAGSVFGYRRPISASYLGAALRSLLGGESLIADHFEWCAHTVKAAVHHVRELCESEADLLQHESEYWWRQGA